VSIDRSVAFVFLLGMALFSGCRTSTDNRSDAGNSDGLATDATDLDAAMPCFICEGSWSCGVDPGLIELTPASDGCYLSGLPGRKLLSDDGTITENGIVVGKAVGSGARVHVYYPDGGQWTFCAGGGGCK
jgi:hypothetical protein